MIETRNDFIPHEKVVSGHVVLFIFEEHLNSCGNRWSRICRFDNNIWWVTLMRFQKMLSIIFTTADNMKKMQTVLQFINNLWILNWQ